LACCRCPRHIPSAPVAIEGGSSGLARIWSTQHFLDVTFDLLDQNDTLTEADHASAVQLGVGSPDAVINPITASRDSAIRAFASATDRWLYESKLPASAFAGDIRQFVTRIGSISSCSPEAMVLAAVYWHRAVRNGFMDPDQNPSVPSPQICVTITMLAASKMHDELYGDNRLYANAAGIPCAELNDVEFDLYKWLNWELNVTPAIFKSAQEALERVVASSPLQGPIISMSASLGGASSAPCSLMLTPSHEASTTGSNAKQNEEDLGDRIFRQALLHCNSVEEAWKYMEEFQKWCYQYDPDQDEMNLQWMIALENIGFDESTVWAILHWGLVLCQDEDTFMPCFGDTTESNWAGVVARTPSDPCVVAQTQACLVGPSRLSHHTRSRSCSFSSVSNKQRKNEWTYHLEDIQRHVGQAADVKTIKAQEKAAIKKTTHKAESNIVAKHTEYKAHDTFMREETTLLVQDAQLLSCTEVSGLEQEVDEVTRKMQIVLSHFNYDHTQVIAAVLNIGGVLSGFAC